MNKDWTDKDWENLDTMHFVAEMIEWRRAQITAAGADLDLQYEAGVIGTHDFTVRSESFEDEWRALERDYNRLSVETASVIEFGLFG